MLSRKAKQRMRINRLYQSCRTQSEYDWEFPKSLFVQMVLLFVQHGEDLRLFYTIEDFLRFEWQDSFDRDSGLTWAEQMVRREKLRQAVIALLQKEMAKNDRIHQQDWAVREKKAIEQVEEARKRGIIMSHPIVTFKL